MENKEGTKQEGCVGEKGRRGRESKGNESKTTKRERGDRDWAFLVYEESPGLRVYVHGRKEEKMRG